MQCQVWCEGVCTCGNAVNTLPEDQFQSFKTETKHMFGATCFNHRSLVLGHQTLNLGLILLGAILKLAKVCLLYVTPDHLARSEYLAISCGGYLYINKFWALSGAWLNTSERSQGGI